MENSKLFPSYPAKYPVDGNRSPEAEYGCMYLASFLKDTFVDGQLTNLQELDFPYFQTISDLADAEYSCIWIGDSSVLGVCQNLDDLLLIYTPVGIMLFSHMDLDSANRFLTFVELQQFYDFNSYFFLNDYPSMLAKDLAHLYPLEYKEFNKGILFSSSILGKKQLTEAVLRHSIIHPLENLDPNKVELAISAVNETLNNEYQIWYTGLELIIEEASYLEGEEILRIFLRKYNEPIVDSHLKDGMLAIGDRLKSKVLEGRIVFYFESDQGGFFEVDEAQVGADTKEIYRKFVNGDYFSPWAKKIAKRFPGYLVSVEPKLLSISQS